MIKKMLGILSLTLVISVSGVLDIYAKGKYNKDIIEGSSQEISMSLNKDTFKKSKEAILINANSIVDALSATTLAYLKDAPIISVNKETLNEETKLYLEELGVEKVIIIGGTSSVSEETEEILKEMDIEVQNISGKNRYETSLKIAKEIDKTSDFSEAFIMSSESRIEDGMSIYSYAAKNNMPIIWANESDISEVSGYLNKLNLDKVYAIGNTLEFTSQIEEDVNNHEIIERKGRNDGSNMDILKKFYDVDEVEKVYTINTALQEDRNASPYISLGVVAAKYDAPILVCTDKMTHAQDKFVENETVKEVVQIGKSVDEYSIKDFIMSKKFISNSILIVLIVIMGIRAIKS